MEPRVIIGADGGGTKTNLMALDAATGKILAQSTVEGTNRFSVGTEQTVRRILEGIRALAPNTSLTPCAFAFGDPAMDDQSPEDGRELRELLQKALGIPVYSRSDVFMALYALTAGDPGALLIAGTGSMGVALRERWRNDGSVRPVTVGGWGYPSTDGGSGYSIATKGINAAFDAFDGVAPPTDLCEAALAYFDCRHPRELIGRFHDAALSKSRLASFALQVNACAEQGDEVAASILKNAADRLGRYALSLLGELPEGKRHLGLFGSVLINNQRIRSEVTETVLRRYPDALVEIPARPPEWGAAKYAMDCIGGTL